MTQAQKNRYLKSGGLQCPFCRSNNIESDRVEYDDASISANVQCQECRRKWRDTYKVVSVVDVKE